MPDFEIPELSEPSEMKRILSSIEKYIDTPVTPKKKSKFKSSNFDEVTALKTVPTRTVPTPVFITPPSATEVARGWPSWLQFTLWTGLALVAVVIYFFVYALYLVPG